MKFRIVVLACVTMLTGVASAQAQQEVKIGVLDPLSGPTAQIGIDAVAAIKTAAEIVNEGADLPLALAKNKGLPRPRRRQGRPRRRRPSGQTGGGPKRNRASHYAGEGPGPRWRLLLLGDRRGEP